MDDAELEHLSPDFDPATVTIPRLRAILLAHDVDYPASAKKQQLIDLFNEQVVPQARAILSSRAHTKPSSRGITNAASTRESSVGDDFVAASVEETPRRASRRSTPKAAATAASARSSAAPSSRASTVDRKQSSFSDAGSVDADGHDARRRTRHSLGIAAIKEEPSESPFAADESPFSAENPFQSGSSPLSDPAATNAHRKRTKARKSPAAPSNVSRAGNSRAGYEEEDVKATENDEYSSNSSSAGEEFTPEEQLELEQDDSEVERRLTRAQPRRRKSKAGGVLQTAPWAVLMALLGGFATVWRQEKLNVGYCGIGRPSTSLGGVQIPEWAHFLRPECEPCPQHAYCFSSLQTTCEPGFIFKPHPLALNGVVPLVPTCEPDGEKARKVKAVADKAVGELRQRNAEWECGEVRDGDGKRAHGPEMPEQELKAIVSGKRRRGMSQDDFEDLWSSALGEMLGRDEVASDVDGQSGGRRLRSTSLANVGLACAARRSVRLALARHLWKLVAVIAAVVGVLYARTRISGARLMEARAKQLASMALERLATQAALNKNDRSRVPEAWMSVAQLRDDVLRDEFSPRKRQKLWERVQAKVENNSNVRSMVRQGSSGEVGRAWEWIGATRSIENGSVDLLASQGSPPPPPPPSRRDGSRGGQERSRGRAGGEGTAPKRWDEGRPVY